MTGFTQAILPEQFHWDDYTIANDELWQDKYGPLQLGLSRRRINLPFQKSVAWIPCPFGTHVTVTPRCGEQRGPVPLKSNDDDAHAEPLSGILYVEPRTT